MKDKNLPVAVLLVLALGCSKSSNNGYSSSNNNNNNGSSNTISIAGMAFSPSTFTTRKGTVVTWKNNDNVTHTATANGGLFNTGNIAAGASASYTADSVGTFPYHCEIHPGMTATLVVTN